MSKKKAPWHSAPEWAQFYAVDPDGTSCWYEHCPAHTAGGWHAIAGRVEVCQYGRESYHYGWGRSMERKA